MRDDEFVGTQFHFENSFGVPQRCWGVGKRHENKWEHNIKVELPEFHRTLNSDEFVDWLNALERVFDYYELSDEKNVKLVSIRLKGQASARWEQLQTSRQRKGKGKIRDWEKMKKKFPGAIPPFQ